MATGEDEKSHLWEDLTEALFAIQALPSEVQGTLTLP
jgi:hypothetical protein